MTSQTRAWGTKGPNDKLEPMTIERRELRPEDVAIEISHCGICHSDLHFGHDDWGMAQYPMVPGHEIIGTVTAVGSGVTRYAAGDRVGGGCRVDSCRTWDHWKTGPQQIWL